MPDFLYLLQFLPPESCGVMLESQTGLDVTENSACVVWWLLACGTFSECALPLCPHLLSSLDELCFLGYVWTYVSVEAKYIATFPASGEKLCCDCPVCKTLSFRETPALSVCRNVLLTRFVFFEPLLRDSEVDTICSLKEIPDQSSQISARFFQSHKSLL